MHGCRLLQPAQYSRGLNGKVAVLVALNGIAEGMVCIAGLYVFGHGRFAHVLALKVIGYYAAAVALPFGGGEVFAYLHGLAVCHKGIFVLPCGYQFALNAVGVAGGNVLFLVVYNIGHLGGPGLVKLVRAVTPQAARVASGGGVAGIEVIHAVYGLVAGYGYKVTAGAAGSAVFKVRILTVGAGGILNVYANAVAVRKLLTYYVKIGILNIYIVAVAARGSNAEGPVAEAVIVAIVIDKGYFLGKGILAAVVEQGAYGGCAAHGVGNALLAHHLGIRGRIQHHLFGQFNGFAIVNGGYVLAFQRVLIGNAKLPYRGGHAVGIGMEGHFKLNPARGFAILAGNGERIRIHIGQIALPGHGAALHAVAPFAPAEPFRPALFHVHIRAGGNVYPCAGGGVRSPGSHHVFKRGRAQHFAGVCAFAFAFLEHYRAVAYAFVGNNIFKRTRGKILRGGKYGQIALYFPVRLFRHYRHAYQRQYKRKRYRGKSFHFAVILLFVGM